MNSVILTMLGATTLVENKEYGAVGWDASPYLTFFYKQGMILRQLANPATMPTEAVVSVEWSRIGNYCVVATATNAYVYVASGMTVTLLRTIPFWDILKWSRENVDPDDDNSNTVVGYEIATDQVRYALRSYKSTKTFDIELSVNMSSITPTFVDAAYLLDFYVSDGSMVGASSTGDKLFINELSGAVFSYVPGQIFDQPSDIPIALASSRDGEQFVVLTDGVIENVVLYYYESGYGQWASGTRATVAGTPVSASFSDDGRYLGVVYDTSPYYAVIDLTVPSVTTGTTPLGGAPTGVQMSYDGVSLVTASSGSSPLRVQLRDSTGAYVTSTAADFDFSQPNATALSLKNNEFFT